MLSSKLKPTQENQSTVYEDSGLRSLSVAGCGVQGSQVGAQVSPSLFTVTPKGNSNHLCGPQEAGCHNRSLSITTFSPQGWKAGYLKRCPDCEKADPLKKSMSRLVGAGLAPSVHGHASASAGLWMQLGLGLLGSTPDAII